MDKITNIFIFMTNLDLLDLIILITIILIPIIFLIAQIKTYYRIKAMLLEMEVQNTNLEAILQTLILIKNENKQKTE